MGELVKVGWITGWGVEPESLANRVKTSFPGYHHEVVLPGVVEEGWPCGFEVVVGWSWGAFRLMEWRLRYKGTHPSGKQLLIAPFASFCSEDGLGGLCSRLQVRYLRRWLKRDPLAALADFYLRAGLDFPLPGRDSPHWTFWEHQLESMENSKLDFRPGKMSLESGFGGLWVGENDQFLNAGILEQILGAKKVPTAGHNIFDFFSILVKEFEESHFE